MGFWFMLKCSGWVLILWSIPSSETKSALGEFTTSCKASPSGFSTAKASITCQFDKNISGNVITVDRYGLHKNGVDNVQESVVRCFPVPTQQLHCVEEKGYSFTQAGDTTLTIEVDKNDGAWKYGCHVVSRKNTVGFCSFPPTVEPHLPTPVTGEASKINPGLTDRQPLSSTPAQSIIRPDTPQKAESSIAVFLTIAVVLTAAVVTAVAIAVWKRHQLKPKLCMPCPGGENSAPSTGNPINSNHTDEEASADSAPFLNDSDNNIAHESGLTTTGSGAGEEKKGSHFMDDKQNGRQKEKERNISFGRQNSAPL